MIEECLLLSFRYSRFVLVFSQLASAYPEHPFVTAVNGKAVEFDDLAIRFKVPPLAIPTAT